MADMFKIGLIFASAMFVLFAIACALVAWKIKAIIDSVFSVDVSVLVRKFERQRERYPEESEEQLVMRVISREAKNAGIVGMLTGFGGLLALPLGLPIDAISTLRIQYRLAQFVHSQFSTASGAEEDRTYRAFAMIVGVQQVSDIGSRFLLKMLLQFAPKIILESVPVVGGIVGFAINYTVTRAIGRYCLRAATASGDRSPAATKR